MGEFTSSDDLKKIPPWIITKLGEETKQRKELEKKIAHLEEQLYEKERVMEEFKEKVKGAMEKLEQQHREKTLSYKQEVQKWKDQKDLEYQQKLSEKEEALARERKNIENYIEEMKSWKESHHQKVEHLLNKKDEELKKKDDELKRISIKLESYEKGESLSPHSPSTKPQSKFKTSGSFIRKRTNSNNASPVIDNRGISSSSLLFLEPKNQLHNKATELQTKIEQLTQQKEEYEKIIQEAVDAKEKLSKIDKAIARNKKDWEETRKDIEKAEKQKMGKKEKDMSENDRSIASDPKWRRALLYAIPRIPIRYSDKTNCVHLEGPESEIIHTHHNYVAAYSLSAYPIIDGKREGDPICDRYCISIFPHCIIATIADGCGWGSPAREAALRASTKFVEYMTSEKNSIYTTRQAAKAILRAFLQAHKAIVSGVPEDIMFMCGTTTMLGGIAFPLSQDYQDGEPGEGEKWAFVFVSLGDCKAYRYNHRTKQLSDISIIFRETAIDPRDPGGRLGPHLGDGSADLRNLSIYCIECEEGDILSLVSDGVHDNLGQMKDPQNMGKLPSDIGIEVEENSWKNVKDHKKVQSTKSAWSEMFLNGTFLGTIQEVTPSSLTEAFVRHAITNTKISRIWMEENQQKLPDDAIKYPGKMDHITCLSFKIGSVPQLNN